MAARGAHLTVTVRANPSIFEVLASESLDGTFYPAFKKLVEIVYERFPEYLSVVNRYYDEFYLAVNGLIQYYYLKEHGGSLSEIFYGLRRINLTTNDYSRRDRVLSLLLIVLLPYIKRKLLTVMKKWKDDSFEDQSKRGKMKLKTANAFYVVSAVYQCANLANYILYMAKKTSTHNLEMGLCRLGLDYVEDADSSREWSWGDFITGKLKYGAFLTDMTFRGLEFSAFFLQFIQWWQNDASQKDITSLPMPEPPALENTKTDYMGICPICFQSWEIPTAILTSGYVYCYKCILNHLRVSRKCPVTNYPFGVEDLVRIFTS